jgi:hypothetical protein
VINAESFVFFVLAFQTTFVLRFQKTTDLYKVQVSTGSFLYNFMVCFNPYTLLFAGGWFLDLLLLTALCQALYYYHQALFADFNFRNIILSILMFLSICFWLFAVVYLFCFIYT